MKNKHALDTDMSTMIIIYENNIIWFNHKCQYWTRLHLYHCVNQNTWKYWVSSFSM